MKVILIRDTQFAFKIIHSLGRGYEEFVEVCEEGLDRPDAPVPTSETVLSYLSTWDFTGGRVVRMYAMGVYAKDTFDS